MNATGADAFVASETAPHAGKSRLRLIVRDRPRRHSGRRGRSLACAAFFVHRDGLLRIVSCATERIGSAVCE
jgi:hypothetical protein